MRIVACVALVLLASCSKPTEPNPSEKITVSPLPSASVVHHDPHAMMEAGGAAPLSPVAAAAKEIAWDAPKAWTSVPNPNPMRKATYKIAKVAPDADDAELAVSTASGGVEANVQRWKGQFGGAEMKTEKRTVAGLPITIVEIKGTYAGAGPMMGGGSAPAAKDKQMLLGAVVDVGDAQHFFKMIGPEKTVGSARKDFDALIASVHAK